MRFGIPLEQMSVEDKLQAMEEIWADLLPAHQRIYHLHPGMQMYYAPEKSASPKGHRVFWIWPKLKKLRENNSNNGLAEKRQIRGS